MKPNLMVTGWFIFTLGMLIAVFQPYLIKSCPVTVRRKCNADWAIVWYLSGEPLEVSGL